MSSDTLARPATGTDATVPPRGLPITAWVLRQQRRAMVGWSLALAVVSAIYVAFYPAMGGEEMAELIQTMPESLVQALGYEGIGTAPGYLESTVFSLLAPALLLVFAIGFGARVLAGQEEDGTLELELTLPVDRRRVLLERFVALAVQIAVFAAVVLLVVSLLVLALDMDVVIGNIVAVTVGLFLLTLALGTVTLAAGAASGRRSTAVAVGAGLAVAGFMADVLSPLVEGGKWLATVSPFGWYLGNEPLTRGMDWAGSGALLGLTLVALAIALPLHARRDLGV